MSVESLVGTENFQLGDRCIHCKIFGEQSCLADPELPVANRIAADNSCCRHAAVVDRQYNKKRSRLEQKRRLLAVLAATEIVDLDNLRKDSESIESVGRTHRRVFVERKTALDFRIGHIGHTGQIEHFLEGPAEQLLGR